MLDSIKVLKNSTQDHIKLEITMKYGEMLPANIVKPFILYGETDVLVYKMKKIIKNPRREVVYDIAYKISA